MIKAIKINKDFNMQQLQNILNGEKYDYHMKKIFGIDYKYILVEELKTKSKQNNDLYTELETKINNFEVDFNQMNTYNYFINYSNFISNLSMNKNCNSETKLKTFIKSLCEMYIGHNLHYKVEENISKKTNLRILKGDYFFSLGYFNLSKIGNPILIKYYSKISENLSRSIFTKKKNNHVISNFGKKFVFFIYLGCQGIKEILNIDHSYNIDLLLNFSIKYATLIYLKEESGFLKNNNRQYLSKLEDLYHTFILYTTKALRIITRENSLNQPLPDAMLKQVTFYFRSLDL